MDFMFFDLPKIELHCHLDGSMGVELTKTLLEEQGHEFDSKTLSEILQAPMDCKSLAEYLKRFDLPIACLQTTKGLKAAAKELALSAAKENVKYIEVRFAPSFSLKQGLKVEQVLEAVWEGLEEARKEADIYSGIIVCGMRHLDMDTNLSMLKASREFLGNGVVACDLAGDEKAFSNRLFYPFFEQAKKYDMPFTIHSGECGDDENVKLAIEFGASRIGHGIAMAKNPELMKLCESKHIGVELCPTSNLQTKAVLDFKDYPFGVFRRNNILMSINTDNRTVSGTTCTNEYDRLAEQFVLTIDDAKKIYKDSIEVAFASDDIKQILWTKGI